MIIPQKYKESIARHAARRLFRKDANIAPSKPLISFTFDDVPVSAATRGAACLERHDARGTFYIAGGLANQLTDYDALCANSTHIQALHEHGHEIGCHTYAHEPLKNVSRNALIADLNKNADMLADILPGANCENFAYPYNAPTLSAKRELQTRYRSARGGIPALNLGKTDLVLLNSVPLQKAPVDGKTSSQWIEAAVAQSAWLIFFTHDIDASPSAYGTTPDILEHAITTALKMGCEIHTVSSALDRSGIPALGHQNLEATTN
ncbi:MAG: polysaccharide deacetylase family protein [Pseudomonadota bacterium]